LIIETHGEVCRLGYLRAVTAIAASMGGETTLEYIAAMLHTSFRARRRPTRVRGGSRATSGTP